MLFTVSRASASRTGFHCRDHTLAINEIIEIMRLSSNANQAFCLLLSGYMSASANLVNGTKQRFRGLTSIPINRLTQAMFEIAPRLQVVFKKDCGELALVDGDFTNASSHLQENIDTPLPAPLSCRFVV